MNPERPASIRTLLARLGGVLLGALVLYAAGAGPASYYETRYQNTGGVQGSPALMKMMQTTYRPLGAGVQGTSLDGALAEYRLWWSQRAAKQYPPPPPPSLPPLIYTLEQFDERGVCHAINPNL